MLNEERKVTAKLGPLPGLHQDITLAESVAFLWYLRHVSALGVIFYTDSRDVHRFWTGGPEYSTRGQFIFASTLRRTWERIDEIGTHLIQVDWVKGHAIMQHVRAGTTSLWQLQANDLADEQAKKGSALHPSVAQVEQSYSVSASFLRWLAKFLGRLHAYVKFRGAQGAHAAREAGGAPTRAAKEKSHARQIFARTRWRRQTIFCSRNPTDRRWWSQPGMRWAGRTWSRRLRRELDGTGAMWYMSWSAMCLALISLKRDTNLMQRFDV